VRRRRHGEAGERLATFVVRQRLIGKPGFDDLE
jgi:hypothetical protein